MQNVRFPEETDSNIITSMCVTLDITEYNFTKYFFKSCLEKMKFEGSSLIWGGGGILFKPNLSSLKRNIFYYLKIRFFNKIFF